MIDIVGVGFDFISHIETYLALCQTSIMELFCEEV